MQKNTNSKIQIIVLGYLVRGPLGGRVLSPLQYVLGLHKMGHNVIFIEDSDDYESCYNPHTNSMTTDPTVGFKIINDLFIHYGLINMLAYFDAHKNVWYGMNKMDVYSFCQKTDILINLSGVNPLRDWAAAIPSRIFIDTDPAFTQIRHLTNEKAFILAAQHNIFFSYGENIGKNTCSIPNDGFDWKNTRQPLVPDIWSQRKSNIKSSWTTVMRWDSYKAEIYKGETYGMKSVAFKEYLNLPKKTNEQFELAIGSPSAPRKYLEEIGWKISNPLQITKTPWDYQQYIANSKGEWSIAKHGYVVSNSGWFSERSLAYLASGRPVIVQDTGFSAFIETGKGIIGFSNMEEVIEGIKKVNLDYNIHCKNAKKMAEEYFDATKVLQHLINSI